MDQYTTEEKVILWLDSFEELTYRQKQQILCSVSDLADFVSCFAKYESLIRGILPGETVQTLRASLQDQTYLPSLLSNLAQRGIFIVTIRSADYPACLAETPAPPVLLYCKGNRALLGGRHFSIVGSRRTLSWAQSLTRQFSARLSRHLTIVTGLAEGGDAAALQGALSAVSPSRKDGDDASKANVISVLAYGFDYVYPSAHADLLKKTAALGLVVTEHRPAVKPQKYLFPARNRIIAGMSEGVLVVSGGKRSGTSITAGYALEYGRDVFCFPYNPDIAGGEGCNALLKSGAYLVDCEEDILLHYGCREDEAGANGEKNEGMPALNPEEAKIMQTLAEKGEAHVEELSALVGAPPYLVNGLLAGLEVRGLVARVGGNRYAVVGKRNV